MSVERFPRFTCPVNDNNTRRWHKTGPAWQRQLFARIGSSLSAGGRSQRDKTSLRYRRLHPCCLTNNCVSDTNHCKVGLICSQTISHESAVQERKYLRIWRSPYSDLPPGSSHNKWRSCSSSVQCTVHIANEMRGMDGEVYYDLFSHCSPAIQVA